MTEKKALPEQLTVRTADLIASLHSAYVYGVVNAHLEQELGGIAIPLNMDGTHEELRAFIGRYAELIIAKRKRKDGTTAIPHVADAAEFAS